MILIGCQRRPCIVCGAPAAKVLTTQEPAGAARRRRSARSKVFAHGHSSGARRVGCRRVDEATRDGEELGADRSGHYEVVSGVISPSIADQRTRLCASAAVYQPGGVGVEVAQGTCSMPAPSFRSLMASSTVACARWKASTSTGGAFLIGQEGEVAPLGPQGRLAADQPGAAHDQPAPPADVLGHLGDPVHCVVDGSPRLSSMADTAVTTDFTMRTPMV